MEEQVRRIKRELIHKGSIVNFYTDHMQLPDGRIVQWDYVEHPKSAAAVLPVLPDGRILMVKQYRDAVDRFTLEIPAGGRDHVEEPYEACAKRELEEETGYRCENLEFLISVRTTVAFCNERIDVFVARELIPSKQQLDEAEFVEIKAYEPEELCQLIYDGEIQDAKTIAAVMAYKNKY